MTLVERLMNSKIKYRSHRQHQGEADQQLQALWAEKVQMQHSLLETKMERLCDLELHLVTITTQHVAMKLPLEK